MVQRATCSSETSASLNDVANGDRKGGTSNVVVATDAVIARGSIDGAEAAFLPRSDDGAGSRGGRFSLFRWFKRNRDSTVEKRRRTDARSGDGIVRRRSSVYSSVESVDTFYSTTTVRSFAFHSGTLARCNVLSLDILKQAAEVGPFAAGASKVFVANKENRASTTAAAYTLPTNVYSRKQDITARYSLHPSTTFASSCGNFSRSEKSLSDTSRRLDEHASYNGSVRRRVHVKGKRRAPNPPDTTTVKIVEVDVRETPRNSSRRKRRAPRPPERITENRNSEVESKLPDGMEIEARKDVDEVQSISNDTLVLQGGMLLSKKEVSGSPKAAKNSDDDAGTSGMAVVQERAQSPVSDTLNTAMPRPWYKRSVFEHSRDTTGPSKKGTVFRNPTSSTEVKDECVGTNMGSPMGYSVDASLSRLNLFHRGERQSDDRKRQEAKRKSGLSILTNISELDKEAAAIVQEEQARTTRASMLLKTSKFADAFENRNDVNEEIVQDMVTSAIEGSSPRRGTRALISKFNAISNITKVTVNANFFARRDQSGYKLDRDATRNHRFEQIGDWRNQRFSVQQDLGQSVRVDKDISRYFLPQQRTSRRKSETSTHVDVKPIANLKIASTREENHQSVKDASSRISFLQSQLTASNRIVQDITLPVNEEKLRLQREIIEEKRIKESPKFNSETNRKLLFSRARNLAETTENALGLFRERPEGNEGRSGRVQKEFSDIFDEIDRQLRSRELKLIERRPAVESDNIGMKVPEDEATVSSKVAKVLDILVEAEKDGKTRSVSQPERSIQDKEIPRLIDVDRKTKSGKTKSTILNTIEDPITADLKEMLKEMKHSLPKRPRPKKPVSSDVLEKVEKRSPVRTNKIPYLAPDTTAKTEAMSLNDYEIDKQKVSSSAQTSGNIRRLNQPSTSDEQPSTSAWKHENVLYRTSGKGSAFVKNTFQLIRPRDFAEIGAMKTTNEVYKENTYANVIEPSLYANAHVPPGSPKQRPDLSRSNDIPQTSQYAVTSNIANEKKLMSNENEFKEEDDNSTARNMNTLAINRLLRKLEGAIASGHHQQAAGLAKELARLKIHCSVIRQRSAARLKDQLIKVNMYIEDKLAHQGPIPLQLPTGMTVAELKTKVHTEFEIPTNVQRWIIGKNLADHDEATLNELHAVDGSPVFLYLVAPEFHVENPARSKSNSAENEVPEEELPEDALLEPLETVDENEDVVEKEEVISAINQLPEQEEAETDISEDVKIGRYEELISLENWDVIPNSEPIECPICFVTYGPREGVILRDCLHMFCRPCIANTIAYCEEAEVKCPYRDSEYTCESTLQEREIKALVEPEIYQQHLAKSIAQAENNAGNKAFHCKTPDCPGWCIYDDDVNNFLCPVCGANNCLTCQVVHTGKNCKQYQQEVQLLKETDQESRRTAAMLKEMVDKGEALACPTCAVVLIKKWGCDWLVCSMCKTEICWVTKGPRWGPGGKGDTSGGCRCGENGVKCHPRCNYCH